MTCHSPLEGFRSASGKGIAFNPKDGYRDLPMQVPCGQCLGCRIDKSRQWALRCVHESTLHELSSFVTLTYDNEHLPASGSLVKKHLQDFIKRLRRFHEYHTGNRFRFYACGEYGDIDGRPHYHAILFGIDFADKKKHTVRGDNIIWRSDKLNEIWGHGHCWLGNVSFQSAAYCARYVIKKIHGPEASAFYGGRVPEFSTMSTKPGIGAGWFAKYKSDAFPSDFLVHQGKKIPVPKFYTDKLTEKELKPIKANRRKKALDNAKNNTPERLAVRAEVLQSKISTLKRSI